MKQKEKAEPVIQIGLASLCGNESSMLTGWPYRGVRGCGKAAGECAELFKKAQAEALVKKLLESY